MFQSVGEHTQGKSLCARDGFLLRAAVGENPRNLHDLRDPASVGFLFSFNAQGQHLAMLVWLQPGHKNYPFNPLPPRAKPG